MSTERNVAQKPKGAFWLAITESEPGDRIIYHVGKHCAGEHRADAAAAYEKGLVILVQRRSQTPEMFDYLAVRSKKEASE